MRFVLLIGCLSLGACAALVTMRLPSLNRKVAHFRPSVSQFLPQDRGGPAGRNSPIHPRPAGFMRSVIFR